MKALTARTHLPYDPLPAEVTREVKATVAAGEIVSLSFSLDTRPGCDKLELFPTALKSSAGANLHANMDLYVVHRWQQAGIGVFQSSPMSVSELLLKDDRVELRDRYVRRCGSFAHLHKSRTRYLPPDLRLTGPVRTSIESGSTKQFWISITVPNDAQAGHYEGSVVVRQKGRTVLELGVNVEVLGLHLAAPSQNTMLWYRGTINCHHPHHYVRPAVFEKQLEDIYDHGFRSISLWETDTRRLQRALDIAQSAGFCGDVVMDGFREALWSSVDFGRLRPVAYVSDELDGHGDRMAGHVASMKRAKACGIRTMASVLDWRTIEQKMGTDSRPDVVSVYAPANRIGLELPRSRRNGDGDLYYYWQAHMEKPLIHRLLAGLLYWKSGADGISPYCYQHLPGFPHSPFDDFDPWDSATHADPLGRKFKDHMATYPARRGVIHTVQWKGLADGLTDFRYLATLDSAIRDAEKSDDPAVREYAAKARSRLQSLAHRLQWTDIDILSETSATPYPGFGTAEILAIRESIVDELKSLADSPRVARL